MTEKLSAITRGIRFLGIVIIGIGAAGIVIYFGSGGRAGDASFLGAVSCLFSGVFILGFAHVMRCLEGIDQTLRVMLSQIPSRSNATELYFYAVEMDIRGPLALRDLQAMRRFPMSARMITGDTLVCCQGELEWKRLAEVK